MTVSGWRQLENGRVAHRFEPFMLVVALAVVPVVLLDDASPRGAGHVAAIVVASLPLLPAAFAATRLARLVRLLRLVRLAMFGARAIRTERGITSVEGFRFAAVITLLLVASAGFAVSLVDSHDFSSPWLGVWWAIVTVTTVGYGDVVPHTVAGRALASLLMLGGIGFLSVLTATVASAFLRADRAESRTGDEDVREELRAIREQLDRLEEAIGRS
jgi:voltage-gated potassium channel